MCLFRCQALWSSRVETACRAGEAKVTHCRLSWRLKLLSPCSFSLRLTFEIRYLTVKSIAPWLSQSNLAGLPGQIATSPKSAESVPISVHLGRRWPSHTRAGGATHPAGLVSPNWLKTLGTRFALETCRGTIPPLFTSTGHLWTSSESWWGQSHAVRLREPCAALLGSLAVEVSGKCWPTPLENSRSLGCGLADDS